LSKE
jgi:hypothetical protein